MDQVKRARTIKIVITAITLLFGTMVGIHFIIQHFVYKHYYDGVDGGFVGGQFRVIYVEKNSVADKVGIKVDDIILAIDNYTFKTRDEFKILNYLNRKPAGSDVIYHIKRGGSEYVFTVKSQKTLALGSVILNSTGFVFLLIGYIVIMSNPMHPMSRLYFWFSFVFFFALSVSPVTGQVPVLSNLLSILRYIPMAMLGAVIFHFFSVFAGRSNFFRQFPWMIYVCYIPEILVYIGYRGLNIPGFRLYNGLTILIYCIVGFVLFYFISRKIQDKKMRKPLNIIFYGGIIGLLPLLTIILAGQILNDWNAVLFSVFISMIALLPLSFGYAVMKYGLMDIIIALKKGMVYSMTTGTFILLYMLLVVGVGDSLARKMGIESKIINAFFVAVVAVVFNPVKVRFQAIVDRKFYPDKYNYRKALLDLSKELPTSIKIDVIISKVSTRLKETLQVQKIVISVKEKDGKLFRMYNRTGIPETCDCDFIEDSKGLTGVLAETRNCITFFRGDENSANKKISLTDMERIKHAGFVLVVPMFFRDCLTGMLMLGPKFSGELYSQEDMELLEIVAGQTAIAVENANRHKDELEHQRIAQELKIAHDIQQNLLPKDSPHVPGLEVAGCSIPATEVGGDYFDYIQRGKRQLLVFVGDVSGKGIPAALYMSKVQGMLQISGTLIDSPKQILSDVNRKITGEIDKNSFITILSVLFDVEWCRAIVCRAGHTPLYIKTKENRIESVLPPGVGLGLMKEANFDDRIHEVEIPLESGDYYILYSDGLVEAMNSNLEMFGSKRFEDVLLGNNYSSAFELRDLLMKQVAEFRGEASQFDDITIVIVKVE